MGYWKDKLPTWLFDYLEGKRKDWFGKPKKTYSGEGEDLIIEKFIKGKRNGVYVDVGCYHPKVGSNTFKLFKKGWSGINIDPNPNTIKTFNQYRPGDINLNIGISESGQKLVYHEFKESAVSTFSEEFYQLRLQQGAQYIGSTTIETKTLADVFNQYLGDKKIDVLDIDTEGIDIEVLRSNDWTKFKPQLILVEDQDDNISNLTELESYKFLAPLGYKLIAKTMSTAIYSL
ncbi:MAG TPA: FkbM family methyltransferase [Bacteroidia bacterium]